MTRVFVTGCHTVQWKWICIIRLVGHRRTAAMGQNEPSYALGRRSESSRTAAAPGARRGGHSPRPAASCSSPDQSRTHLDYRHHEPSLAFEPHPNGPVSSANRQPSSANAKVCEDETHRREVCDRFLPDRLKGNSLVLRRSGMHSGNRSANGANVFSVAANNGARLGESGQCVRDRHLARLIALEIHLHEKLAPAEAVRVIFEDG